MAVATCTGEGFTPLIVSSINGVCTVVELPEGECLCAPICGLTGAATGPTGPAGATGAQGPTGEAGAGDSGYLESSVEDGWATATNPDGMIGMTGIAGKSGQCLAFYPDLIGGSGGFQYNFLPMVRGDGEFTPEDDKKDYFSWNPDFLTQMALTQGTTGAATDFYTNMSLSITGATAQINATKILDGSTYKAIGNVQVTSFAIPGAVTAGTPWNLTSLNVSSNELKTHSLSAADDPGNYFSFTREDGGTYENLIKSSEGTITVQSEDDIH